MKCKIFWLQKFWVYYLQNWFGSFLLLMIGRLFKVLAMLTCMQEVGDSDQWLISVKFLSTFGFGLEFPVRPPYTNWESFMDAFQELMVLSFATLCGKWTLGWLLLEISDFFSPCVRALWFTQHPGIEISALNQVTFSSRNFQLFKMSWSWHAIVRIYVQNWESLDWMRA